MSVQRCDRSATVSRHLLQLLLTAAVAFAGVLLLPSGAAAQAALTGTVHDASGAVLLGVTVEAASPVLIEKVRTTATARTGRTGFSTTTRGPGRFWIPRSTA